MLTPEKDIFAHNRVFGRILRQCPRWRLNSCGDLGDGWFRDLGSNFAIPHRLSSSSLQHSRTTVQVCDSLMVLEPRESKFDYSR